MRSQIQLNGVRRGAANFLSYARRTIKNKLPEEYSIYRALRRSYRLLPIHLLETNDISKILDSFAETHNDVFFLQIGACDGVIGDPISVLAKEYNWAGLLVEPEPSVFAQLVHNYRTQPNVKFANVAISQSDGQRDFWYVSPDIPNAPQWSRALGSFHKDVIMAHSVQIPELERHVRKRLVNCVSFDTLVSTHNVRHIDVLHIDTEGFDFEIIKQVNFDQFKPSIILYEDKHLSLDDSAACRSYLQAKGYRLLVEGADVLAYSPYR